MGTPSPTGEPKRVLLVRGGVLTPHSGLGGAFHDLRNALETGLFAAWCSAGTMEYDLGSSASPWKRLMTRWYRHPKKVKNTVHRLQEANQLDLVLVSDQEQAHLVPTNASVPVIVYVHDFFHLFPQTITLSGEAVEVGQHRPGFVRRRDLRKVLKGLKRADAFICNTDATAALCRQHFPSMPLFQIPYALDVGNYRPPTTLPARPETLPSTKCHLLVVGSHDPRKRLKFLMEVLRGLPKTVLDDLQVHHIGGEDCPNGGPSASAMAANLTLPWHHVGANISDEVLNLHRWYAEALLFPSGAEGFGYPPVESMAAGQPVLASDMPAHNELMPEGACLDPEDVNAWRTAIVEVHGRWLQRNGTTRTPDPALMEHVEFLSPDRFYRDMAAAWDECTS